MVKQTLAWIGANYWRCSPMAVLEKLELRRFDRRHGLDTARDVRLAELSISSLNKQHGMRYHATPPLSFRRILNKLRIDFSTYTFIDFGSGKGRTLLLASEFPFKRIIGVEFGEELHRQALGNIARYPRRHAAPDQQVQAVHADATEFALPDGALLLYFFNPFNAVVLRQVLANIAQAARDSARPIFVVYLYLEHPELFAQSGQFKVVLRWHRFVVYQCQAA